MLNGKLGVDFFSISDLLYPDMEIRLRFIGARPNFYMISDNPNVSLGIVNCWLYTRRFAPKDDYHKERIRHDCICSCGIHLFGDSGEYFCHFR